MKCIIYGLGSGIIRVENYLKNEHCIIGYSDSFYTGNSFNGNKFYKPEELIDIEFDYIIIAIGEEKIFNAIYKNLVSSGIDDEKIIKFYEIYAIRWTVDKNYKNNMLLKNNEFDGIILGISHARDGINTNYLNGNFLNLAIGSQDLYYNLKQLNYLVENHYDKIKNLKYAILDMYTYTYFNYDVSLSSNAIVYYWYSGFKDDQSHNFKNNIIFTETIEKYFEDINKKMNNYLKFCNLFNDNFNEEFKLKELMKKEITSKEINEIKINKRYSSIQTRVFEKTIEENIQIFEKILSTLFSINENIKIYLVLIPQYIETEKNIESLEKYWKNRFFAILNRSKKKYNFEILDFKSNKKISSQKHYYYNYGHLNNEGAMVFTKLLNAYIK